jgi:hypothetical protein
MRAVPARAAASNGGGFVALKDWKFAVLFVLAIGTIALLGLNISLSAGNRERLKEVTERQQFIDQTVSINRFSAPFIQGLAQLAAREDDAQIRQVLADNGVTFTVPESAADTAQDTSADAPATEPEAQQ